MNLKRFFMYGIPKSFLLKIIIFLIILLLGKNVFASEINVSNKVRCSTSDTHCVIGTDITSGIPVTGFYNVGTRYTAKLTNLTFYISSNDYNFVNGKTYTITINMETDDWRNHFMYPQVLRTNSDLSVPSTATNWASSSVTFVSMKKIKFNFKVSDPQGIYVKFYLYSGNSTPFTGVSNFKISSISINDNVSTPTPIPAVTPTPTPTPQASNKDIINNANQNTQDIINNNNTNTQDIINNANQNNSDIIENANNNTGVITDSVNSNCKSGPYLITKEWVVDEGQYLDSNTGQPTGSGFSTGITDYLVVSPDTDYTILQPGGSPSAFLNVCLYGANKENLACYSLSSYGFSGTLHTSKYTQYIRIAYPYSWWYSLGIEGPICNDLTKQAQDKTNSLLEQQNQITQDTNNYLKDNSDPNLSNNELNNVLGSVGFQDPLNYLLTLPTQLINKLVQQSNSCQVVNLGTLWGVSITLPCLDIGSIVGQSVWNTIDVLFAIALLVNIFSNLYHTFANLITLGAEKEARDKFNFPTPMDFLARILGGGK